MEPESLIPSASSLDKDLKALKWEIFTEKPGIWGKEDFSLNGFVDHLNTTKYTTDYLWYMTRLFLFSVDFFYPNIVVLSDAEKRISRKSLVYLLINYSCPRYTYGYHVPD